jgi:hypothetical protein
MNIITKMIIFMNISTIPKIQILTNPVYSVNKLISFNPDKLNLEID